jgi:two-component system, NarL family, nitrate/nitrite response regulator NarL
VIRVLICDEHTLLGKGLQKALESCPDISFVGQAGDVAEAVRLIHDLRPDILLLDVSMNKVERLCTLRRVSDAYRLRTIVLNAETAQQTFIKLSFGANAVLLKKSSLRQLLDCIRSVHADPRWMALETADDLCDSRIVAAYPRRSARSRITPREMDVIAGVVAGYSNKQIAAHFSISERTVKHYLSAVFIKTGVSSRLELALYARDNNLATGFASGRFGLDSITSPGVTHPSTVA